MRTLRDIKLIKLNDRSRPIALVAGGALLAGLAGIIIGKSIGDDQPAVAVKAESTVEAGDASPAPEGIVPMTAARLASSGIAVERIALGSLAGEILAQATVAAPPEGQALLTARADGAVVKISKRLGDPVGAGETVAMLESREAAAFVSERNAAAARAQAAGAAAAREQRLFNAKITARQDLEAAIAARRTADADLTRAEAAVRAAGVVGGRYLAVRSPINGRLTEVDTQLGAYVTAGAELFNVSDPRSVQINASVSGQDAQLIQPGDQAFIELPSGGLADARVRSSTPALDPQSRTATVVLQLSAPVGGLRQGQGLRVRIVPRGSAEKLIVVPEDAIQQLEGRDVVFVQVENGFRAEPVTVGRRSAGRVEIISGLKAGQTIASANSFLLKAELAKGAGEEE